jgi:HD-GYP domain-containing protein (c-di-GMP phosphodiesterase class II)
VGRRLTTLFILCAVVPLAGLALVTATQTARELQERASSRLRHDAKSAALDVFGRLQLEADALRLVGAMVASGENGRAWIADRLEEMLPGEPARVAWFPAAGLPVMLRGEMDAPALSDAEREHLDAAGTLIVDDSSSLGTGDRLLLVTAGAGISSGVLAMSLQFDLTAGLDGWEILPPDTDVCAFQGRDLVGCSTALPSSILSALATLQSDAEATLTSDFGDSYLVRAWALPLRAVFGAEPLVVTMLRSTAAVQAPVARFRWYFWMVALLSVLIVSWLSLTQVRRQMQPLARLTAAAKRLGGRDFSVRVDIDSGDEFQALGDTFNQLIGELAHQFEELEALTLGTLEALGRTIDAKSPWTAGHSGRVTTLALRIGREMGLGERELRELRFGGPIHDIGKLATPPGILDKPGRLTAEEETILRRHPEQGVHILEPVAVFRPLLPIVGQHHERWDGTGYPLGRRADETARTARVLAVADVFDAMRSHRPYRSGLPHDEVVRAITAGAGTQFDPVVVAAFLRVMNAEGDVESREAVWPTAATTSA